MVDIHCHLMPGIDDGPTTWETTLKLCDQAVAEGITHIVATPHCNHVYTFDRPASQAVLDQLSERCPKINFSLGCEFNINETNLVRLRANPAHFAFSGTRYILVEINSLDRPQYTENTLSELLSLGLIPIIGHPERIPLLVRRMDLLEQWLSYGCLAAVTGNSFDGFWGPVAKKYCEMIVKKGLVHAIVSDAHHPERRPLVLAKAKKAAAKLVGAAHAERLVTQNPAAIFADDDI